MPFFRTWGHDRIAQSSAGVFAVVVACGLGCGDARSVRVDGAAAPDAMVAEDDAAVPDGFELVFEPMLPIANETLIFPPALDQPSPRTLSEGATDDVIVAYTRVGCWVDPEAHIGQNRGFAVRPTTAVNLISVTIEQARAADASSSPAQLAERTCLSVRTPGGAWQPFLQPAVVTIDGDTVRVRFEASSVLTDAAAIFLPTYTRVSRIIYRAVAAP
jgi:hypothetical protein